MGWVSHPLTKKETMGVDRPAAPKLPWSFTVTAGTLGKTAVWYFPSPKSLQRCDMLQGCAKTSSNVIQLYTVYNCHLKKKKREDFPSIFHSKPEKKKTAKAKALHPWRHTVSFTGGVRVDPATWQSKFLELMVIPVIPYKCTYECQCDQASL